MRYQIIFCISKLDPPLAYQPLAHRGEDSQVVRLDLFVLLASSDVELQTAQLQFPFYLPQRLSGFLAQFAEGRCIAQSFAEHCHLLQVALGRLALEPLAVLSALCRSSGREILSLNLHPLQGHVPEAELLKAAEHTLMTAVAQVCIFPKPVSCQELLLNFVRQICGSRLCSCMLQERKGFRTPSHIHRA